MARPDSFACVVLAHADARHVRRLISALDPFPVFLHCDARTSPSVFDDMTSGLPARVRLLPRRRTPWAMWGPVAAELDGYRAALAGTGAAHVALLSGSDYPLVSSAELAAVLSGFRGRSLAASRPLPIPDWRRGGWWRIRYRFAAWRKRMLWLPLPRRMPSGVVLAGGSQLKVLSRAHIAALLVAIDRRPDLVRRWKYTWAPDETFVYSILHTPELVPGWDQTHVRGTPWVIRWGDSSRKSPPWLTRRDLPHIQALREDPPDGVPRLFARKFSSAVDTTVIDEIDRRFRSHPGRAGGLQNPPPQAEDAGA